MSQFLWCVALIICLAACNTASQPTQSVEPTRQPSGMTVVPQVVATETRPIATQTDTAPPPVVCAGTPQSRLIILERGQVTYNNERLNLRSGPGTDYNVLSVMEPGDVFDVLDGPACQEGFTWYRVQFEDLFGWIAEGDTSEYYVQPFPFG